MSRETRLPTRTRPLYGERGSERAETNEQLGATVRRRDAVEVERVLLEHVLRMEHVLPIDEDVGDRREPAKTQDALRRRGKRTHEEACIWLRKRIAMSTRFHLDPVFAKLVSDVDAALGGDDAEVTYAKPSQA